MRIITKNTVENGKPKEFDTVTEVRYTVIDRLHIQAYEYEYLVYTKEEVEDVIKDYIVEALDMIYFIDRPYTTVNDVIEELSVPHEFIHLVGGDEVALLQGTSDGAISFWSKRGKSYDLNNQALTTFIEEHGANELTEQDKEELESIIQEIRSTVNQRLHE